MEPKEYEPVLKIEMIQPGAKIKGNLECPCCCNLLRADLTINGAIECLECEVGVCRACKDLYFSKYKKECP